MSLANFLFISLTYWATGYAILEPSMIFGLISAFFITNGVLTDYFWPHMQEEIFEIVEFLKPHLTFWIFFLIF